MILLTPLLGALSSCSREPESKGPQLRVKPLSSGLPTYSIAVHALQNPVKLTQAYQPPIDHLNNRLNGARLILQASRDYAGFEEKYRSRKPEILIPNPWQRPSCEWLR